MALRIISLLTCAAFSVLYLVPIRRHLHDGLYGIPLVFCLSYAISLVVIIFPKLRLISWLAVLLCAATICMFLYLLLRNYAFDLSSFLFGILIMVVPAILVGMQIIFQLRRGAPNNSFKLNPHQGGA